MADEPLPQGWQLEPSAIYGLEQPVRCPSCREGIDRLFAVRL
jgi:hypothetical protein